MMTNQGMLCKNPLILEGEGHWVLVLRQAACSHAFHVAFKGIFVPASHLSLNLLGMLSLMCIWQAFWVQWILITRSTDA